MHNDCINTGLFDVTLEVVICLAHCSTYRGLRSKSAQLVGLGSLVQA